MMRSCWLFRCGEFNSFWIILNCDEYQTIFATKYESKVSVWLEKSDGLYNRNGRAGNDWIVCSHCDYHPGNVCNRCIHLYDFNDQRHDCNARRTEEKCWNWRKSSACTQTTLRIHWVSFANDTVKWRIYNAFNSLMLNLNLIENRYANDDTALYQPIFASLFAWSLVTMTGAMLMIEMELKVQYLLSHFCSWR